MKTYRKTTIRRAEIAQVILLQHLYIHPGSHDLIFQGVYLNLLRDNRPTLEEIACFLRTPSYISCEWALNRHEVLLQAAMVMRPNNRVSVPG